MRHFFLVVLAACAAIGAAGAARQQKPPDANEIVRRSVAAIEADWSQAPNYSFVQRGVESKHDAAPTVKTYEVLMIDGSPYNRLIAVNDKTLSSGEQAEEGRKLVAEIDRREHESNRERTRRVAKYVKERNQDHTMIREMVDAFDFQIVGEETIDGHDCWVLDAKPKPGYRPTNRETKVLAGMQGKLWVEKTHDQWVRVQAEVMKPVNFYGFIAKVGPGTRFLLEQEQVHDNLWLPKRFSVHVSASTFGFINQNSNDDETYENYRPMPANLAGLEARK